MTEVEVIPRFLSGTLGWVWRSVGGAPTLHLMPAMVIHPKARTACGRKLTGVRLGDRDDPRYCLICTERNGGVAP